MSDLDLRSLNCFAALAETLNFREAAVRLNLTQPALSLRLMRLEDSLGFRLFERSRSQVLLSQQGKLFLPQALSLLKEAQAVARSAEKIKSGDAGELRIGVTPLSLFTQVPQLIGAFRQSHPEIAIQLDELLSDDVEIALQRRTLDVGFLHPPIRGSGLNVLRLPDLDYVAVLPERHPLAGAPSIALADLRDEPFILVRRSTGPAIYDQIFRLCYDAGFTPHVRQETSTSLAVLGLVAAGQGCGLVIAGLQSFAAASVRYVPLRGPRPKLPFALGRAAGAQSRVVNAFVAAILQPENMPAPIGSDPTGS